jgi:putative ABC transport system substrate-binding protein
MIGASAALAQGQRPRIGILGARPQHQSTYAAALAPRLAELGYGDVIYRHVEGFADRYPKVARELISAQCQLIFALGNEHAARALQDARAPVAIVFLAADYDPVDKGIVASLRKPDRNSTGIYLPQSALVAKRVEIMREVLPSARRLLVFADPFSRDQIPAAQEAAERARMQLTIVEFSKQPYDFAGAFETGRREQADAFMVLASSPFGANAATMAALALKYRQPSIGSVFQHAQAGFLISFNADATKVSRRMADIGAKILKGAKPADIPVEQADEFELAVNAKTARALGVKIPESVLARATRIVQ